MRNQLRLAAGLLALAASGYGQGTQPVDQYYDCIRNNDARMLHALLNSKGVNFKDNHATTPLHYAAAYGSAEALREILAAGAGVNAANDFGATALMWAVAEPEKVRVLVAAGADVNAKSKMGRTALYLAAANDGSSATVRFLLEHGAKPDGAALGAAALANDMASVKLLVEQGAPVNQKDGIGITPLMWAAGNGNLKMVELLLAKGANVNAISADKVDTVKNGPVELGNLTALMLAAPAGGAEVVKALLDARAEVNAVDVRKMTPLMLAVATDHADPRTVRLLAQRGANAGAKDRDGLTAGDWAKKYNSPAVLRELGLAPEKAQERRVIAPTSVLGRLEPKAAAERSIALLQQGGGSFFKEGGCGSCHSHNLTSVAVNAAYANHVAVNEQAKAMDAKGVQLAFASFAEPLLQRGDPPVVDILIYAGLQFASDGLPADRTTDAVAHNLMAQQRAEGNWHVGWVARPPMGDGDFSRTALGIRYLQMYGPAGRKAELQKRIALAAKWLMSAKPRTTEDVNMQLLGLKWANAALRPADAGAGLRRLLQLQREDGGWGQTAELPSDAYATGQALYTLHELGVGVKASAYRRGVQYLLETQAGDGSWHVKSRAAKFQPYFETTFPYGHDQWISAAATSWAATALSYASDPQQVARR